MMRIAYADPPYPGCANLYDEQAEVDHRDLLRTLFDDYDGFVLHTSSVALASVLQLAGSVVDISSCRIMAWVKPFAAFKRNVSVAYAWEPVLVRACRKPVVTHRIVMRDWVSQSITLKKGLVGAKPEAVARWAFEMVGALPTDELYDLYPGTGAIARAWQTWCDDVAASVALVEV